MTDASDYDEITPTDDAECWPCPEGHIHVRVGGYETLVEPKDVDNWIMTLRRAKNAVRAQQMHGDGGDP